MTKKLITLKPTDSIDFGLSALLKAKISGAPVVDEEGNLCGIFTERSCMNVIFADQYHGNRNTNVGKFLYEDVIKITPSTGLIEIGMLFLNNPIRRLPVVDGEKLVGQVSRSDVLRAIDDTRKKARKMRPSSSPPMPYYSALIDPHSYEVDDSAPKS